MVTSRTFASSAALVLSCIPVLVVSQVSTRQLETFWKVREPGTIVWTLEGDSRLPHEDNIEMSGERVAAIITYSVDTSRILRVSRDVIFPQLVRHLDAGESPWQRYRAYLREEYDDRIVPMLVSGTERIRPGPVDSIVIDGVLSVYHAPQRGLAVRRRFMTSMTQRLFAEVWTITNMNDSSATIFISTEERTRNQTGKRGVYTRRVFSDAPAEATIGPARSVTFGIYVSATLNDEPAPSHRWVKVEADRRSFLEEIRSNLVLETPDPVINTLFLFAKTRASESIFDTPMGLVHSPGGGRYYTGVWANDQCEYSGPFFPYLGYDRGNSAALNAYRQFARNIPTGDGHFWSSYEMNGELTCCGGDRGDAAMIAFGASQFALANGDRTVAKELLPLIEWSLDYCDRQKNEAGVIRSDTDEMEGRIPTGSANLSTSSLYYGALQHAADLTRALGGREEDAERYSNRARELRKAIDVYFGATIEGLETYRYYDGHTFLRHWICLPLVVGIEERKDATLDALFSRLWTPNGVKVEHNPGLPEPDLFWDRGTLYAFRGAFKAGGGDRALERLRSYSSTRLLGFHVPYPVEAWPEGNMAHLSAESALYCRIFTEGLLGMTARGLTSFEIRPHLPAAWSKIALRRVHTHGQVFDIFVERENGGLVVIVETTSGSRFERRITEGEAVTISF